MRRWHAYATMSRRLFMTTYRHLPCLRDADDYADARWDAPSAARAWWAHELPFYVTRVDERDLRAAAQRRAMPPRRASEIYAMMMMMPMPRVTRLFYAPTCRHERRFTMPRCLSTFTLCLRWDEMMMVILSDAESRWSRCRRHVIATHYERHET